MAANPGNLCMIVDGTLTEVEKAESGRRPESGWLQREQDQTAWLCAQGNAPSSRGLTCSLTTDCCGTHLVMRRFVAEEVLAAAESVRTDMTSILGLHGSYCSRTLMAKAAAAAVATSKSRTIAMESAPVC